MGGVVGIGVGIGLGQVITPAMGMEFAVQTNMVMMSFGFAVFIGVFFGIAPARKAAKLHPIEALRSE